MTGINDAAKGYLEGPVEAEIILQLPALVVRVLPAHHLLAMKLSAWRDDVDIADARVLLAQIKGNRETVWSLVVRHIVPGRELKASLAFADLWDSRHEAQ